MTDLEIIKQIEKELNVELKKLDEIRWDSQGYTLDQNRQVMGLGLCECKIKNLNRIIRPLKELKNLIQLYLVDNQLIDISPLKDLKNLKELNLYRNKLSDISMLNILRNLRKLDIEVNKINDISSLKELKKLKELFLNTNKISDISPLKS